MFVKLSVLENPGKRTHWFHKILSGIHGPRVRRQWPKEGGSAMESGTG